ncbi:MAG TPA: zf-HC2 domain-containing protein [Ktedonobacteraceae bacterium]|jgi:anti-sigma factor RsiW|nr:zf-HC2 domain-containing protein [Ktedonobacteraceae bacterium]
MAGNTRWSRDEGDKKHPEQDEIFAFIRGELGDTSAIQKHIKECSDCQHTCQLLYEGSQKLNVLGVTAAYLRYPERSPAQIFDNIVKTVREEEQRSQRAIFSRSPGKRAFVLHPVYIVLAALLVSLLATGAVWAFFSGNINVSNGPKDGSPSQQTVTAEPTLPSQGITPTATVAPSGTGTTTAATPASSPTANPSPTASPSPIATSPAGKPYVQDCSTPQDQAAYSMSICGQGFTPGDRVVLFIIMPGGKNPGLQMVQVDASGQFKYSLVIGNNCRTLPIYIYAQDTTNSKEHSLNLLVIKSLAWCAGSSPGTQGPTRGR